MSTARYLTLAAGLAAAMLGAAADAAAAKTSKYASSYVDLADDGVFDPGTDVLLSSILGPDDTDFDTRTARPGYTPPGGRPTITPRATASA